MKKVVVKLGRSIATSENNTIDENQFENLSKQIKLLHERNIFVILVVSAAVSCGEQELGLIGPYSVTKHLVAGVGQAAIMADLHRIFRKNHLKIAQLLVTKSDLQERQKRENIKQVIHQAAERNIVLVVNENDIAELHSFEGNDYLAAEIAKLVHADSLLFLTDVQGVLDDHMQVMKVYSKNKSLAQVIKTNGRGAVGGMQAKLDSATSAATNGIDTWISNGRMQNLLIRILLENEHIGTKISNDTL